MDSVTINVKPTENQEGYFNTVDDQVTNLNQSNSTVVQSPVIEYSEEKVNIHPHSIHYTGPPEPAFQNCLAPKKVEPQQVESQPSVTSSNQVAEIPYIRTRTSSGYTNHSTTFITPDEIDRSDYSYHEGTLFCAIVSKAQIKFENAHPEDMYKDRKKLVWNKYKALISPNGKLELYKSCQCKDLHFCLTQFRRHRPTYNLDLHPSQTNLLFSPKNHHVHSVDCTSCFRLSLQSPVDYSWSLSTPNKIFFFQAPNVRQSREWYRALYMALPLNSKRPLPTSIDLVIPHIPTTITMPLSNLSEGENVNLEKVRESALALLQRDGLRPSGWNRHTIGMCWESTLNDLDWALIPSENPTNSETEYLVGPRLIEKTHELQMRYYIPPEQVPKCYVPPPPNYHFEGYVRDASRTRNMSKTNQLLYVSTLDNYLFLFAIERTKAEKKGFSWFHKKPQEVPSTPPPAHLLKPENAIGVVNMCDFPEVKETRNDDNQHLFHVGNTLLLEVLGKPFGDWTNKHKQLRKTQTEHVKSTMLYVKDGTGKMNTFKQRLCVLTKDGNLCIFKTMSKRKMYRPIENIIKIDEEDLFIYSGLECCHYINGIPGFQNARLYSTDRMPMNPRPKESCFVIKMGNKEKVFFTESKQAKEEWVSSICLSKK